MRELERGLRPVIARSGGAKPMLYVTQRHYRSQRALPEIDARLDVDLRTAVPAGRARVKHQPQWLGAVYEVLRNKRSNIQLGLDVRFRYDCPVVQSREVLDLFAGAWIAADPLVRLALGDGEN